VDEDARHESPLGLSRDRAQHRDVAVSAGNEPDQISVLGRLQAYVAVRAASGYRLHILLEQEGIVVKSQARAQHLSTAPRGQLHPGVFAIEVWIDCLRR
jgi:hypothetical protein